MKSKIFFLATAVTVAGCGSIDSVDGMAVESVEPVSTVKSLPAEFNDAGCIACHGINETRVGPAFAWIATRYKDSDEKTLHEIARKIVNGGAGAWGIVPMIANPQVSQSEAEKMVKWIVSADYTADEKK